MSLLYPQDWLEWLNMYTANHGDTYYGKQHGITRRPAPLYPSDLDDRALILDAWGETTTCAKWMKAWRDAEDSGADEPARKKGFYDFSQCAGLTASKLDHVLHTHHYPERPRNQVPSRQMLLTHPLITFDNGSVPNCGPQQNMAFIYDKKKYWENDNTDPEKGHGHH